MKTNQKMFESKKNIWYPNKKWLVLSPFNDFFDTQNDSFYNCFSAHWGLTEPISDTWQLSFWEMFG